MPDLASILALWEKVPLVGRAWKWLRGRVIGPLHLIPKVSDCQWWDAVEEKKKGMGLRARFHVTNARADYVWLVATRLRKPRVEGVICVGETIGELRKKELGVKPSLPPGLHRFADARFFITPSIPTEGEDFVADVVIVDNCEVEHRRQIRFTYTTLT